MIPVEMLARVLAGSRARVVEDRGRWSLASEGSVVAEHRHGRMIGMLSTHE
jgi:hypothetical protein